MIKPFKNPFVPAIGFQICISRNFRFSSPAKKNLTKIALYFPSFHNPLGANHLKTNNSGTTRSKTRNHP